MDRCVPPSNAEGPGGQAWLKTAPVLLIFCGNNRRQRMWHEWRGRMEPIYLPDLRAEVGAGASDERVLEDAVRPLAGIFQVSPEAMRIRLEAMELVQREKHLRLF